MAKRTYARVAEEAEAKAKAKADDDDEWVKVEGEWVEM